MYEMSIYLIASDEQRQRMELPNFMDLCNVVDLYNSNEISDEKREVLVESLRNECFYRDIDVTDWTSVEMIHFLEAEERKEAETEPFAHVEAEIAKIAEAVSSDIPGKRKLKSVRYEKNLIKRSRSELIPPDVLEAARYACAQAKAARRALRTTIPLLRQQGRSHLRQQGRSHRPATRKAAVTTGDSDDDGGSDQPDGPHEPFKLSLKSHRRLKPKYFRIPRYCCRMAAGRGRH
jgi:hypothetical protein